MDKKAEADIDVGFGDGQLGKYRSHCGLRSVAAVLCGAFWISCLSACRRCGCIFRREIDCGRGTRPLHCIVFDLSETGARMTLARDTRLPEEFVLVLAADGRSRRRCRIARRDHLDVSVRFLPYSWAILIRSTVQSIHQSKMGVGSSAGAQNSESIRQVLDGRSTR